MIPTNIAVSFFFGFGRFEPAEKGVQLWIAMIGRLFTPQDSGHPSGFILSRESRPKPLLDRVTGWGYPLVNQHGNGNLPFPIGNTSTNGGFSNAMLVYRSVDSKF